MQDEREYDIDFFLDNLEGVRQVGEREWLCRCPAHEDRSPSLSVRVGDNERVLMYCFAGCGIGSIMDAIETRAGEGWTPVVKGLGAPAPEQQDGRTGFGLWMDLFDSPVEDFDPFFVGGIDRHLRLESDRITFLWPTYPSASRYRIANPSGHQKGYYWGKKGLRPPIWPEVEEIVNEEIYLTEGESDCIVLRRCGLSAYGITTGGTNSTTGRPRFSSEVLREIVKRGAKRIYLAFDDDDVGHNTAEIVFKQLIEIEKTLPDDQVIEVRILPISKIAHAIAGEKDVRQVWLRLRDPELLAEAIRGIKAEIDAPGTNRFMAMDDYVNSPNTSLNWLVEQIALRSGIGWISGYPKMGKSFLALDLVISVATGSPFLGRFNVLEPGDVLYIVKENSDASLINRLVKISKAKRGFGVRLWSKGQSVMNAAQQGNILIDPSRRFRFEPSEVEALIHEITKYTQQTGRQIRLICIDPLSFSLPSGRFDLNTFTDVQTKIVDPIAHIIRRTGACVFVVHHQSKGDGNSMLGSIATEASFDNKISFLTKARGLTEHTPGDPVLLQVAHRDGSVFTIETKFTITDDSYAVEVRDVSLEEAKERTSGEGPKIRVNYLDRQKEVAAVISSFMGTSELKYAEIFEGAMSQGGDLPKSLVENTFAWMQSTGQIKQVRRGVYQLS